MGSSRSDRETLSRLRYCRVHRSTRLGSSQGSSLGCRWRSKRTCRRSCSSGHSSIMERLQPCRLLSVLSSRESLTRTSAGTGSCSTSPRNQSLTTLDASTLLVCSACWMAFRRQTSTSTSSPLTTSQLSPSYWADLHQRSVPKTKRTLEFYACTSLASFHSNCQSTSVFQCRAQLSSARVYSTLEPSTESSRSSS